ncbi:ATP-binding protein [Streptomyces sp. SID5785]|nr:ATP-binding protein [Streptomyces sp. SID5785]
MGSCRRSRHQRRDSVTAVYQRAPWCCRSRSAQSANPGQLSTTIARCGRVDLLCIDELGDMELDRRGAELRFQVLAEREERNSVAIASDEAFGGWPRTFADPRLGAAA